MRFRLISQQFTFEKGEVAFAKDFASVDALARASKRARITNNQTEDLPNGTRGELQLLCTNCDVRLRSSDVAYHVPALRLTAVVNEDDILAGAAEINIGHHGLIRVEAVDRNDKPLARPHVLGVAMPQMSTEVKGPEGSPLYLLLPPGDYFAYLGGFRPVQVHFVVREEEENIRTVTLRDVQATDQQS